MKTHSFNRDESPGGLHIWWPSHCSGCLFKPRGHRWRWLNHYPGETWLEPLVSATCWIWSIIPERHINREGVKLRSSSYDTTGVPRNNFYYFISDNDRNCFSALEGGSSATLRKCNSPWPEVSDHRQLKPKQTQYLQSLKCSVGHAAPPAVPRDLSLKITISMKTKGSLGRAPCPLRTYLT